MSAGRSRRRLDMLWVMALMWLGPVAAWTQSKPLYQYFRVGAAADIVKQPQAGFALMGGGKDLDEAFRWMCERAHGGDFLVLRAAGTDAYNPYVNGLEDGKSCKLNSVATLIIPSRAAAGDPFVAETIAHAEGIFIAGGDQANYIRYWMGTPVQTAINAAIARGVPLGGTSAGLAVMGEWAYSAEGDKPDDANLDSKTALMNPLSPRITLVHGFLDIPILKGIITDSHFGKRDRMGRLLVFIDQASKGHFHPFVPEDSLKLMKSNTIPANLYADGLGIDEQTAVLVEINGSSRVVGQGSAHLIRNHTAPKDGSGSTPDLGPFTVQKLSSGASYDLRGPNADSVKYTVTGKDGNLQSSQPGGSLY
jgi:cyanophycinase